MKPAKHWTVTAHGDTVYVQAQNKAKAVEVVEGIFGVPPGAIQMDVQEVQASALPAGETWLK